MFSLLNDLLTFKILRPHFPEPCTLRNDYNEHFHNLVQESGGLAANDLPTSHLLPFFSSKCVCFLNHPLSPGGRLYHDEATTLLSLRLLMQQTGMITHVTLHMHFSKSHAHTHAHFRLYATFWMTTNTQIRNTRTHCGYFCTEKRTCKTSTWHTRFNCCRGKKENKACVWVKERF